MKNIAVEVHSMYNRVRVSLGLSFEIRSRGVNWVTILEFPPEGKSKNIDLI